MANLIDYLHWRGDLTFAQSALNEVDSVLFVFLAYFDLEGIIPVDPERERITLREAIRLERENHVDKPYYGGAVVPSADIQLMARLMSKSNRFAGVRVTGFVNQISEDEQEQFSAYTALLDDGSVFISFRGTDDTLVGWKEDMNMTFTDEIPGQRSAVEYLNRIGRVTDGGIRIGGHSKGGNLAVYAAARCAPEIQDRIIRVYNNDGPGFSKAFFESEGYLKIKERVLKLVPQESVIGMLLGNDDHYTVVRSAKSGVLQHNCYLWEVRGRHFVRQGTLTKKSLELSQALNAWISDKDEETRRELADAFYEILTASEAKTLTDLTRDRAALLRTMVRFDPKKREMLFRAMMELCGELIKVNMPRQIAAQASKKKPELLNAPKEKQKQVEDKKQ